MRNANKILLGTLVAVSMAACGEKPDSDATTSAAPMEGADLVVSTSLIPAQAGIAPLDAAKLADVAPTRTPCQLDFIAKQSVASQPAKVMVGDKVLFQGWISNPSLQPPDQFAIVLAGQETYAFRGTAGGERPDVAKILKAEGLAKAGFNVEVKFDGVAPGEYAVSFIQEDNGHTIQCLTSAKAIVSGGA